MICRVCPSCVAEYRPYATSSPGTGGHGERAASAAAGDGDRPMNAGAALSRASISSSAGHRGDDDEESAARAGCRARRQQEAGAKRADDGAERVRRVRRRRPVAPDPRPREASDASASGKLAPQSIGRGQHREQAPHEIELKLKPGIGRDRRVDRPIRQRRVQNVRRPGHRRAQQQLAPGERHARTVEARARASSRRCCRCPGRRERPPGSARTCRSWHRTAATACASRALRPPAPSARTSAITT